MCRSMRSEETHQQKYVSPLRHHRPGGGISPTGCQKVSLQNKLIQNESPQKTGNSLFKIELFHTFIPFRYVSLKS